MLEKIAGDWTTPDNCISLTDVAVTKSASSTVTTFATQPTSTTVGTYLNLYPTEYIYGEVINWSLLLGFGFRSAETLGC